MSSRVTFGKLEDTLVSLGFEATTGKGGQRIYQHAPTDGLIVLPRHSRDDVVSPAHIAAVKRTLTELDLADPIDFFASLKGG